MPTNESQYKNSNLKMIIIIKSSTQENILKNNLFTECLPCHLNSVYENTIHRKYILKVHRKYILKVHRKYILKVHRKYILKVHRKYILKVHRKYILKVPSQKVHLQNVG